MDHWSMVLDIVEAGLEGDRVKVRAYAELLLDRLGRDPLAAPHLRRILPGAPKGIIVLEAGAERGDQEEERGKSRATCWEEQR